MQPTDKMDAALVAALEAWTPEMDDRTHPLLYAEAARRDAREWAAEDAENVIAFLLSHIASLTQPTTEPSEYRRGVEDAAKVADVRAKEWKSAIASGLSRVRITPAEALTAQTEAEVIALAIRALQGGRG